MCLSERSFVGTCPAMSQLLMTQEGAVVSMANAVRKVAKVSVAVAAAAAAAVVVVVVAEASSTPFPDPYLC